VVVVEGTYRDLLSITGETDLFQALLSSFPHPVQVYKPDGVLVFVNEAFIREFQIDDPESLIGKYNLLTDPTVAQYGALQNVETAFSGTVMYASDFIVPVNAVKKSLNLPLDDVRTKYSDILTIPLHDQAGVLLCIVNILMTRRTSMNRKEIQAAIQYIESHWLEDFNLGALSNAVHLSPAHFSRLFKEYTGKSPREYHIYYKLQQVKVRLIDEDLSVTQAFEACGLTYHGYYARLFKEATGVSPSEYRKNAKK
jgi:AraC-like DNA-binding protein